ncbi:MAG TPA: CehA/McbA family metallohydrolase [Coriobacteriia bacterium]
MQSDSWSAADLHIHTTASDGVATPAEVVDWVCSKTDLTVIAIADHNTNLGAIEAAALVAERGLPLQIIISQEVESADGHILGLWTPEIIPPGMSAEETVVAIHAQGGFAVAAHPFAPRLWSKAGLSRGNRGVYNNVDYDGIEIANSTPLLFVANWVARFYQLSQGHRFAATGGSDAHILPVIGTSRTYFPGETADDLRTALDSRITTVSRPGFNPRRMLRYARNIPKIMASDRERKAREVDLGIRDAKPEKTKGR